MQYDNAQQGPLEPRTFAPSEPAAKRTPGLFVRSPSGEVMKITDIREDSVSVALGSNVFDLPCHVERV